MKRFLLCMMLAGLMMPVVAQEKLPLEKRTVEVRRSHDRGLSNFEMLPMNPRAPLVLIEEGVSAGFSKSYDRQSQGSVYPMTKRHDDGFMACTWTNNDNPEFEGSSVKNRGVAYSYSTDGGKTWSWNDESNPDDYQLNRVGKIPVYWASYAQWGSNGEVIMARSYDSYDYQGVAIKDGLVLLTRENKGVGEWNIVPVPYPAGVIPDGNHYMAWAQMTTSGDNHQYIHIMSPLGIPEGETYQGYREPVFYYKTHDGGETWDVSGELVPNMVGEEWDYDAGYFDDISFAVRGDIVACAFITLGFHAYALKSLDNGETWTSTKFYHASCRWNSDPEEYADTCYIPTKGCIALDNDGKMHTAFGTWMVLNSANEGQMTVFFHDECCFLSYWNEDMGTLTGDDYTWTKMGELMYEHFLDEDKGTEEYLYVNSVTPKWPIVGFFVPTIVDNLYKLADASDWLFESYGRAGNFSFPQMAFDKDNKLHLSYLGLLDGGEQNGCWKRHPYYTSRDTDGTWTPTEYLVNSIDYIDWEFAYPVCAGIDDDYKMYLMMQVDPYAGVAEGYVGPGPDHGPTTNTFYFFNVKDVAINEIGYAPLTMNIFPNPASKQATVNFEGKGNITVYNMLGQTVYHVENVENTKVIPLNNMATGVYFVTVRSGNATVTQKLIVQ